MAKNKFTSFTLKLKNLKNLIPAKVGKTEKLQSNQKGESKFLSINARLIFTFTSIIVAMSFELVFLAARSISFSNSYSGLLENVYYLNFIKTETNVQGQRIQNMCYGGSSEDPQEAVTIATMLENIHTVYDNIDKDPVYDNSRRKAESIERQLEEYSQKYQECLSAGGGSYSSKGVDAATAMINVSTIMAIDVNALLDLEIARTSSVQEQVNSSFNKMIMMVILIFVVILIFCVISVISLRRKIVKPINILKDRISAVAEGDLAGDPLVIRGRDEFASLFGHFNTMQNNIKEIITQVASTSNQIQESFETVNENISDNTVKSQKIAVQIEGMKERIVDAGEQSADSIRKAETISDISANIVHRTDNINSNAKNTLELASSGDQNLQSYVKQLAEVNEVIDDVATTSVTLVEKANQMSSILQSISDISDQTNLLSLNASIEAARAGESGKGFAVVASEIGKLARDTQEATQRIETIIEIVQSSSSEMNEKMQRSIEQLELGNSLADKLQDSFADIKTGTLTVSEDIEDINAQMNQLSDMIKQIVDIIRAVDSTIQDNLNVSSDVNESVDEESKNMESIASSTAKLLELAGEMDKTVAKFTI